MYELGSMDVGSSVTRLSVTLSVGAGHSKALHSLPSSVSGHEEPAPE